MDSRNFPLSFKTKKQILASVFDSRTDPHMLADFVGPSHSYFCYYQRWVGKTRANSLTNSHLQICNLVTLLKGAKETRSSIEDTLQERLHEDELDDGDDIIGDSFNLAVRVLLMVPTGGFLATGRSITLSGETKLSWNDGTIRDFVSKEFPVQTSMKIPVKLEKIFNAMNLEHIAGVEVRWTSNLADHLRMRDDDKTVEMFHYAAFLRLHQKR